jgi:hypothetical protein
MNPQKIILINIDANTEAFINNALANGYVIQHMVSLLPTYTKLLVVYVTPVFLPENP